MDRISKLEKAFELFNNGELKESEQLLRNIVLETAAEMNQYLADQEELIEDIERDQDADLKHDISKDFDEIDAEETYDEGHDYKDLDEDEVDAEDISASDAEDDLVLDLTDNEDAVEVEHEEIEDRVEELETEFDEFHDEFEDLKAEFDKLQAIEDEEGHDDTEDYKDEEDSLEEDFHLEPVKVDMKDKSKKAFGPVLDHADVIELGGEPVTRLKKDSAVSSKDAKVSHIKGGNTVKDAEDALIVESATVKVNSVKNDIVRRSNETKKVK